MLHRRKDCDISSAGNAAQGALKPLASGHERVRARECFASLCQVVPVLYFSFTPTTATLNVAGRERGGDVPPRLRSLGRKVSCNFQLSRVPLPAGADLPSAGVCGRAISIFAALFSDEDVERAFLLLRDDADMTAMTWEKVSVILPCHAMPATFFFPALCSTTSTFANISMGSTNATLQSSPTCGCCTRKRQWRGKSSSRPCMALFLSAKTNARPR